MSSLKALGRRVWHNYLTITWMTWSRWGHQREMVLLIISDGAFLVCKGPQSLQCFEMWTSRRQSSISGIKNNSRGCHHFKFPGQPELGSHIDILSLTGLGFFPIWGIFLLLQGGLPWVFARRRKLHKVSCEGRLLPRCEFYNYRYNFRVLPPSWSYQTVPHISTL